MDVMERIAAVQAATETETPFLHACNMEDPLSSIRQLSNALCMIAETLEDFLCLQHYPAAPPPATKQMICRTYFLGNPSSFIAP